MSVSANVQKHSQNNAGFTEYFIVVFYKGFEWGIRKRYSDFVRFNDYLVSQGYKLTCKLRGKNFWNRYDPTLISRRVVELQGYLNSLLISTMTDNNLVREFLEVDEHMLAEAKKLSLKNRETGFTERLDSIVKDTRKAVMQITGPRRLGTNMHSAAQRAIQQQQRNLSVSSSERHNTNSTSSVTGNSPGPFRRRLGSGSSGTNTPEPSSAIGSPKSARSRAESKDKAGDKDALNYAYGTGSMAQTHLNEEHSVSSAGSSAKASPSTSFSGGQDSVLTGLIRRESLGLGERKDSWGGVERKPARPERSASLGTGNGITVSSSTATVTASSSNYPSRKQHNVSTRSSTRLDAAFALEDSRRREAFARHVESVWNRETVHNMGKVLRHKRSKKRLPLALSQSSIRQEGVNKLSELWESSQGQGGEPSPGGENKEVSGDTGTTEGWAKRGSLQEEIIFKDDENSWILDLLSAPLAIDPLLAMLDEEVKALNLPVFSLSLSPSAAVGPLTEPCVVNPEEQWAAYRTDETLLSPPQQAHAEGTSSGGSSSVGKKVKNGLPPKSPRPATPSTTAGRGLRSLGDDGQLTPLVRANSSTTPI